MKIPKYTKEDIMYAEEEAMVSRAQELFEKGKVENITGDSRGYNATIKSTKAYRVSVSANNYDLGFCDCYMGQKDQLCKHLLALCLAVLDMTGINDKETARLESLADVKKEVTRGMRKFSAWTGGSHLWFAYQRKLSIGSGIVINAIDVLEPNEENAKYLWSVVMKISKKYATGGIDDSDGTIGNCVHEIINVLGAFAKEKPELHDQIIKYTKDDTGFCFEENLKDLLENPDRVL